MAITHANVHTRGVGLPNSIFIDELVLSFYFAIRDVMLISSQGIHHWLGPLLVCRWVANKDPRSCYADPGSEEVGYWCILIALSSGIFISLLDSSFLLQAWQLSVSLAVLVLTL